MGESGKNSCPGGLTILRAHCFVREGGTGSVLDVPVQDEGLLSVFINGSVFVRLACSPSYLEELVVGRLYTEGVIAVLDEIRDISIDADSMRADVRLEARTADSARGFENIVPTYASGGIASRGSSAESRALVPVVPIHWNPEWVFRVADEFARDDTEHALTFGAHSAYLADRERVLYVREDIGRHNAFDKAVGSALLEGVDLAQCLLYTSGRVPTDMTAKAIRARIPVLASKSVATDKTVEMAREMRLTLICKARPDSLFVLNDPYWA